MLDAECIICHDSPAASTSIADDRAAIYTHPPCEVIVTHSRRLSWRGGEGVIKLLADAKRHVDELKRFSPASSASTRFRRIDFGHGLPQPVGNCRVIELRQQQPSPQPKRNCVGGRS